MSKRIIAVICLLALFLGFVPGVATKVNAAENQYVVGYSKKNINPIIENNVTGEGVGIPKQYLNNGTAMDYTDLAEHKVDAVVHLSKDQDMNDANNKITVPIVNIPLRGYGGTGRNAKRLTDDNGDGYIMPLEDGLFVTATFVTDASGNSVVYTTMDVGAADGSLLNEVRTRVCDKLNDLTAAYANRLMPRLQPEHIMLTASHSHASFQSYDLYTAWKTWTDTYYAKYGSGSKPGVWRQEKYTPDTLYGAYYEYIIDQTVQAILDAYYDRSAADMSKGEIDASEAMKEMGYTYSDGIGFKMNTVRHYKVVVDEKKWFQGTKTYTHYAGDNFGSIDAEEEGWFSSTNVEVSHVSESDDVLQILRFSRSGKNDVLMIDWRAHAAINGNGKLYNISSDYVNSLRYYLESKGYCVGFWQGASGNINPSSRIATEYSWSSSTGTGNGWTGITLSEVKNPLVKNATGFYSEYYTAIESEYPSYADRFYRAALYGNLLGKIAEKCLSEKMTGTLDMSEIKVLTFSYKFKSQQYSDDWKTATQNWKNSGSTTYPYVTTVNNKYYVINTSFHSQKLESRLLVDTNWNGAQRTFTMNVVLMGKNVGLVTGSGEMFDNYAVTNADGSLDATKNAWREMDSYLEAQGLQLGRVFAVSYTNSDTGYIPNAASYDYVTLSNSSYPNNAQPSGSYEVNTSEFSKGSGEKVIELFKTMLLNISKDDAFKEASCTYCSNRVERWTPYYPEMVNSDFTTGHYYLVEDLNGQNTNAAKEIGTAASSSTYYRYQQSHPENVHIDLNGHNFYNNGRCFYMRRYGILAIQNSGVGGGIVQGTTSGSNPVGGTITGEGSSKIYLYDGVTLRYKALQGHSSPTYKGGVVELRGELYVRSGARIEGGTVTGTESQPAYGGAVNAYTGSKIEVSSGGEITTGSISGTGYGPCIYAEVTYNDDGSVKSYAKVTMQTSAKVDDIYYSGVAPAALYIGGWFDGRLGITIPGTFTEDTQIGTIATDKHIQEKAVITVNAQGVNRLYDKNNNVYLNVAGSDEVAYVNGSRGGTAYSSLDAAVKGAAGKVVKLAQDITTDVTLTTDATIDLAGHDITGVLNTAAGKKIYLMDSATDDFDVSDGNYAKVKITDANKDQIAGVTAENSANDDGYLMITENGEASFHRVQVKINSMSLRPAQAGLYYNSSFAGDEKVKELIDANGNDDVDFGVALSISAQPNANNLESNCLYTKFTGFQAGEGANDSARTSTLLVDVLNPERTDLLNNEYAKMKIYGRPFIVLPDGQYYFGKIVARSLRQQVEATDSVWDQLSYSQSNSLRNLFETYQSAMGNWNLTNIKENENFVEQKDVIKILEIGNSHGLDSTNLLIEVIKKENPNAKVIVGALYKSGCRLEEHYNYMATNAASYSYHKNATFTDGVSGINTDGSWKVTKNVTAYYGLQDEDWDIITLQQMNHWSGRDYLYIPSQMNYIVNYIKNNKQNPENEPKLMWNMIWANPQGDLMTNRDQYDKNWSGNHGAFKDENGKYSTDVLFANIARCTQTHVMSRGDFVDVLPVGTAIQYALKQYRTNNAENKTAEEIAAGAYQNYLYRDYTHVSDYGRLMIAYVWYAKIFGVDKLEDIKVTTIPENLQFTEYDSYPTSREINATEKQLLIDAVNWAIKNPYTIG